MKINSTGKMAEKVGEVVAETTPEKATAKNTVHTGIAGASDSFVRAPVKESITAGKKGSGAVAGLKVGVDSNQNAVKLDPGLAVDSKGKSLHGSDYFFGKTIDANDLQKDQQYLKGDSKGSLKRAVKHQGTERFTTASDLQRDQVYRQSVAGTYLEAVRGNPALNRLAGLTGISPEQLTALLNQYGLDPGNLPIPPDNKVNDFVHDPAFASIPPQEILQALYG